MLICCQTSESLIVGVFDRASECHVNHKPLFYEGDVTLLSNFQEVAQSD